MRIKFKTPKTKAQIAKLHFVEKVFYEGKEDGWWIHLKEGYRSVRMECGMVHELTLPELIDALEDGIEKV